MIDIGADIGKTSEKFVLLKWNVTVFEPNPERNIYIENILKIFIILTKRPVLRCLQLD